MSIWTPTIPKVVNAVDTVSAETINPIVQGLADRTQYLLDRLQSIDDKSLIIALNQPVADDTVTTNTVVYFDCDSATKGLRKTNPSLIGASGQPYFKSSNSSYVFGVVKSRVGTEAEVWLQGIVSGSGIVTSLLDAETINRAFTGGPLFLSKLEPGKLTSTPSGLAVFVGFASSLDQIYLNPNQESLNEFFWNYKYTLLDRPVGYPTYAAGVWTINSPDTQKVGWVQVSVGDFRQPSFNGKTPKYFYQLVDSSTVDLYNAELTTEEKTMAKDLYVAIPPKPGVFSTLFVNGVLFSYKTSQNDECVYVINDYGIWWFDDTENATVTRYENKEEYNQPWSSDLYKSIVPLSVNGNEIVVPNSAFIYGDLITFWSDVGGTAPGGLSLNTTYYVKTVNGVSITVSSSLGGTALTLTATAPSNVYIRWLPAYWTFAKGSEVKRPRMTLQFTKLNPDISKTLVTSLHPSTDDITKSSISFVDYYTETPATTGDLRAKLNLQVNLKTTVTELAWNATGGRSIGSLAYNSTTAALEGYYFKNVTEIRNGGGLTVSTNDATGVCTVALATAQSNLVTFLEPEQARLMYHGLNSYLALEYNTAPSGFVGKFIIPDQLVGDYLYVNLVMFGTTAGTSSNLRVKMKFEYSVSKPGEVVSSSIMSVSPDSFYIRATTYPTAYKSIELNKDTFAFDGGTYLMKIPSSALAPKSIVNFRIHRLKATGSESPETFYQGTLGVTGVYWVLI